MSTASPSSSPPIGGEGDPPKPKAKEGGGVASLSNPQSPTPNPQSRHFACTRCGACCNRAPEVALSEAAALADVFVFRLMFRLYELPRTLAGCGAAARPESAAASPQEYYETKRLLAAFAVPLSPVRRRLGQTTVEYARYLAISALALDTSPGACPALDGEGGCTIYDRRPLACRTVPFHYSRPEAAAERVLADFAATSGYRCDTSPAAPVVLEAGRIVDPDARRARSEALEQAARDRHWQQLILRRLKTGAGNGALPTLREIEANAAFGATTTSMRVAWEIGVDAGVIGAEACGVLIAAQMEAIDRELAATRCTSGARETLAKMRTEYRQLPVKRRIPSAASQYRLVDELHLFLKHNT